MKKLLSILAILFLLSPAVASVPQKVLDHIDRNVVTIVYIWTDHDIYGNEYAGSTRFCGLIVGKDKILSAFHGAQRKPSGKFYAFIPNHAEDMLLTIVKHDIENDLVLLQMERWVYWQPLKIAEEEVKWGDDILFAGQAAIPYPKIRTCKFTTQYIPQFDREDIFVTPSFHGDSGGGVFNMRGEIIGVISHGFIFRYKNITQHSTCSYAVPLENIRDFISEKDLEYIE